MDFDLGAGIVGMANTAYNLYTNKRDFDYQKALQQQIFEREDTAVQRRMADLKAAGLNPNLAAGSAAGAGAVVSRSTTNDVDMGSALDMIQAANQIKLQKQEVKNKQEENEILKFQKSMAEREDAKMEWQNTLDLAQTLSQLGIPIKIRKYETGPGTFWFDIKSPSEGEQYYKPKYLEALDYELSQLKNSADLLQKDNEWYKADKISGMAFNLLGLGLPKFSYKIK